MSIDTQIAKELFTAAAKNIDTQALAARLAPKIEAEIEKEIMRCLKEYDFSYMAGEIFESQALVKAISAKVAAAFK